MLPYWNSDLDLEIASWFPLGLDYQPVSSDHFCSPQSRRIAALCLEQDSELFFMTSPRLGCIGSLMRDNIYRGDPCGFFSLAFLMILGYAPRMAHVVCNSVAAREDLSAGVAFCSLWHEGVLMGCVKVIALVSDVLFFDETRFLDDFENSLSGSSPKGKKGLSFFAERFGYRRLSMPYETDDPLQLRISQVLYEMEFAETRQMVGPSPEVPFPALLGVALNRAADSQW